VNGVKAHGGSINGTGPTIVGGMVYANAGYSRFPVMKSILSVVLTREDLRGYQSGLA